MDRTFDTYPARANPGTARRQTNQFRRYLGFAVVLGGAVFLLCARLFKMPELTWLLQKPPKDKGSDAMTFE